VSGGVEGVTGNPEVPRIEILRPLADLRDAWPEASSEEEVGSWKKHGFPHATEPEAKEAGT